MTNPNLVYLNGNFLPLSEAKISVLDRGFMFGDGVYEVIPAYNGRLFRLQQHLRRLNSSLKNIRIGEPMDEISWRAMLQQLIEHHGGGNLSVYLQITRGVAARDHSFSEHLTPTILAMCTPLPHVSADVLNQGVSAIVVEDIRWLHCHIKSINLLPNILMRQQAVDEDAAEAILIRNNTVTEGAASNVFYVKNDKIITPPKSQQLLPGITRDLILELAQLNDMDYAEENFDLETLKNADEIWLSSSIKELLPVTKLNNQLVGDGLVGPVWSKLYSSLQQYKQNYGISSQ